MIFFSFPFALQLDILPSNSENGVLNAKRSILDLSIFPPNKHVTGKLTVVSFSQDLSLWAAIFYESSENVSVKVGKDILNLSDWQEVVSPEIGIDCLSKLHWVNESLLILYEDHAWLVDSVKSDAPVCKKILTLKRDKIRSFPAKPRFVKTLNGEAYVYSEFQLYHLKNHQLKPILRFRQDSIPECIPTGNHRFTYVLEGVQYEVDILEGIVRSRSIPYQDNSSSIHKLTSEWAVITREGYTNRDMDVLQFWHLKTDTWKHLKLGAFGQYGIVDMGLNNEGVGILQSEEMLFEVKDFMAKLEGFETLTVGTWSKEWGEEKEPPLIMGFVNRIKTLFKN
jgi:hypothetical protein